jgi:type 1 glutamine amidotransferase
MARRLIGFLLLIWSGASAQQKVLRALIVDGVNNHDWAAATRAIRSTLEGTGRFRVSVATWPEPPEFSQFDVVICNFNSGHLPDSKRWPAEREKSLVEYVRNGGGLVIYHAANNSFPAWREYNEMMGLGWREPGYGEGRAVVNGKVVAIPKGEGLAPGHGPRHDFELFVLEGKSPITAGLPVHWIHPSEQLTHGQHGPAEGITVLTYAFSEVSHQGEPMDWVRQYGRGRVYTTMLGHTWKDEANPNLDDLGFQTLFSRGTEWAATGSVTLPVNLGWEPLLNGRNLDGWEVRGNGVWDWLPGGVLLGRRLPKDANNPFGAAWPVEHNTYRSWKNQQAWIYTKAEYHEFDLHLEYWLPPGGNSGVSIRDGSRGHFAIGEADAERRDLAAFPRTTPAHIGYEIQILDDAAEKNPTGSIYDVASSKNPPFRKGEWNAMEVESRDGLIRVRLNGEIVAESPGVEGRAKVGPIGLQLHDQFTTAMFRNVRLRKR